MDKPVSAGDLRDYDHLAQNGFSWLADGHRFPGRDPRNICNRGRSGAGIQIELSEQLRKAGDWMLLAATVRNVLGCR